MAFDCDSKLLRLVEDVVEILGVQLSPEEGVPVHCSKLAMVLRPSDTWRVSSLPGVKGSRFANFFSARV